VPNNFSRQLETWNRPSATRSIPFPLRVALKVVLFFDDWDALVISDSHSGRAGLTSEEAACSHKLVTGRLKDNLVVTLVS